MSHTERNREWSRPGIVRRLSCNQSLCAYAHGFSGLSNRLQSRGTQHATTARMFELSQLHRRFAATTASQLNARAATLSDGQQFMRDLSQRAEIIRRGFGFQSVPALSLRAEFPDAITRQRAKGKDEYLSARLALCA